MIADHDISNPRFDQLFQKEIASLSARLLRQYLQRVLYDCEYVVTVKRVTDGIGITRQHLARLCRRAGLRQTPQWYLSMARLLAATHLLEITNESASSIAAALRFGDAAALYAMFERYTGKTLHNLRREESYRHVEGLYREALMPNPRFVPPMPEIMTQCSNELINVPLKQ